MVIFFRELLDLLKNLFIVELIVISAFKIQHPAFHFLAVGMYAKKLVKLI